MGNSATSGLLSVNFFDFGFLLIFDEVLARDVDEEVSSSTILLSSCGGAIDPRRFLFPMDEVTGAVSGSSPIKSTWSPGRGVGIDDRKR